jgi:formylglycine-generating enzyme required for sulfatase activity
VRSGRICIDKYEASVWETTDPAVVAKIEDGTVTLADLVGAGAVQRGVFPVYDYEPGCPLNGNGCVDFYAVSIPGVLPSTHLSWFQAAAAARNSAKRLPANAEWQAAALGTPDPGVSEAASDDCNTANGGGAGVLVPVPTGTRANCVSDVGAFDMVGNAVEWVADWMPRPLGCPGWGSFSNDEMSLWEGSSVPCGFNPGLGPAALRRGGAFGGGEGDTNAGVFAVDGTMEPWRAASWFGFRAAR